MSRLHRQKLRARARAGDPQFARAAEEATHSPDAGAVKPTRAKRSRRKSVRKAKAKPK